MLEFFFFEIPHFFFTVFYQVVGRIHDKFTQWEKETP